MLTVGLSAREKWEGCDFIRSCFPFHHAETRTDTGEDAQWNHDDGMTLYQVCWSIDYARLCTPHQSLSVLVTHLCSHVDRSHGTRKNSVYSLSYAGIFMIIQSYHLSVAWTNRALFPWSLRHLSKIGKAWSIFRVKGFYLSTQLSAEDKIGT